MTQNESSITLQWDKVENILTYKLLCHDIIKEKEVNASSEDSVVKDVVSDLTAGREYNFTVFAVFKGASSSGNTTPAVTGR